MLEGYLPIVPLSASKILTGTGLNGNTDYLDTGDLGSYNYIVVIKVTSLTGTDPTHQFDIVCADDASGTNAVNIIPQTAAKGSLTQYTFSGAVEGKRYIKINVTLGGTTPGIEYDYMIKLFKLA